MKEGEKFRWREGKIRPGQKGKMLFVLRYWLFLDIAGGSLDTGILRGIAHS
jgi:hypothetical protein